MNKKVFIVSQAENDMRIDKYLADALQDTSRNQIQRWLDDGAVQSSLKSIVKKNHRLTAGESIVVTVPQPRRLAISAEAIPLAIVYQDEALAVIDKPDGMVVHPAPGNYSGTLVNALLHHLTSLSDIGGVIRPGIVHRIDKDTSGLLMVAKTNHAHQHLSKQLRLHTVTRQYLALVHGGFKHCSGTIDRPIARSRQNRLKMAIDARGGKPAVTHYQVEQSFGEVSLITCKLETGRTHQIRVHMASIGHPLLGDPLYGIKRDRKAGKGQLLHAYRLGFTHPTNGKRLMFTSPTPARIEGVIDKLKETYGS